MHPSKTLPNPSMATKPRRFRYPTTSIWILLVFGFILLHSLLEQPQGDKTPTTIGTDPRSQEEVHQPPHLSPKTIASASPSTHTTPRNYVAICTLAKDEHNYIKEWAQHHLDLGVDKIYLYDHQSQPSMEPVVTDFINASTLHYQQLGNYTFKPTKFDKEINAVDSAKKISQQMYAFRDCLKQHGSKHDWLAFIDVDEFIILKDPEYKYDLPGFLKRYEDYGALTVQWRFLGSSGHIKPPKEGVRASYTHCLPRSNEHSLIVKAIVHTNYTLDVRVHRAKTTRARPAVLENKKTAVYTGSKTQAYHQDHISLYHYYTRSQEEGYAKADMGAALMKAGKWLPTTNVTQNKDGSWKYTIDHSFIDEINRQADENPERCLDALAYV